MNSKILNKNKKVIRAFPLIISVCMLILSLSACTSPLNKNTPVSKTGFYFDTIITITLYGKGNEKELDKCMNLSKKYDSYFSTTDESSDIYKINHSEGEPVKVHDETIELIKDGLYYGKLSDHVFSICCGALTSLWDFEENSSKDIPSDKEIQNALKTIDDSAVEIDGNTVTCKNIDTTGTDPIYPQIDLGGIAKGYIADKLKEMLIKDGITSGIINLGGNVLTIGSRPDNTPYNVGIQKPFSDDGTAICSIKSTDNSVVTSGTYQRYFEKDGTLYHHIINLSTGFPEENNLNSVTIISQKSTEGDALSTICFLLGEEKARELIKSLDNVEAVFIDKENNVTYTDGLKDIISISK